MAGPSLPGPFPTSFQGHLLLDLFPQYLHFLAGTAAWVSLLTKGVE